jgi:hypothetical protein
MQVSHQYIAGNNTAAEIHGNDEEYLKEPPIRHILAGKRVSRKEKEGYPHQGTPRRIKEGIKETGPKQLVIKDGNIGIKRKIHRPQKYPPLDDSAGGTEGTGDNVYKGIGHHQPRKNKKNKTGYMKGLVGFG